MCGRRSEKRLPLFCLIIHGKCKEKERKALEIYAIIRSRKDGKEKTYYIYNVCDHQECYREVGSQAISYTTGVPAMCGALMLLTGQWRLVTAGRQVVLL